MSFSQPHKYKLYYLSNTWNEDYYQEIGYSYMSAMPSKDQIMEALQEANQLGGLSNEYMDGLIIDRPYGWNYKIIRVCEYNDKKNCVWKFEPYP